MRRITSRLWSVFACCLTLACGSESRPGETCSAGDALDGDGRSLTSLSLGRGDSCAVANDGAVVCWGDQRPTPEPIPRVGSVTRLDVGEAYKCAIRPGGSVACWTSDDAELETVPELCNATAVSAVSQSRCAVISDGSVRCWGSLNPSVFGQETSRRPIAVPHVTAAVDIATLASGYTCALISDGSVTCWGGGPGRGDRPGPEPSPVFEIAGAVALAGAGLEFGSDVCAVLEDRSVTCWSQATAPVPMAGVEDVVSLAHGWNHDCGLFGDGLVRCWGGNASGQLGNGTNADSETPVVVEGLSGAVQIALFDIDGRTGRSCALLDDGSAHCWGSDVGGGLGSDTPGDTNTPVRVNFP